MRKILDTTETNHAQALYGVYAAGKIPATDIGLDLYWIGLNREGVAFNGAAGREDRHTMGGRISGKIADTGLDYDLEAAHQFGEIGRNDISALMVASQLGFTFSGCPTKPRLYAGFDYATGDGAAGSSRDVGTELDLTAKYKLNRHLLVLLGYSHFFPGDFIKETGPGDDVDFYNCAVQSTF